MADPIAFCILVKHRKKEGNAGSKYQQIYNVALHFTSGNKTGRNRKTRCGRLLSLLSFLVTH
ncbi:MAG: hypothetical protein KAH24_02160, partial [Holophagae bacterium]|nr:hypothetical protein [Holophagae bacterium]